jgi:hypothetical protein
MTQRSTLEIARHIYKSQGLSKFYSGAPVVALSCLPANALFFSVFEFSHAYFNVTRNELKPHLAALVGALACLGHDLFNTPADVVKQRMQIAGKGVSLYSVMRDILINEGPAAFYRSLPITMVPI